MTALWPTRRSFFEAPLLIVSIAAGVGLVTAAFGLLYAALVQPLPYVHKARLVRVWEDANDVRAAARLLPLSLTQEFRGSASGLEAVAAYEALQQGWIAPNGAEDPVPGQRVSPALFRVLGASAALGRVLSEDDASLTPEPPIVLSAGFHRRLGAPEPGNVVTLGGLKHRIVGVMPPEFWFPTRDVEFWVPIIRVPPALTGSGTTERYLPAIGRMSGDAVDALSRCGAEFGVLPRDHRVRCAGYRQVLYEGLAQPLYALQTAAITVLVLTVLNAAWLWSARAGRLSRSFAVMLCLGASRRRLAIAVCCEAALVAAVAAGLSVVVAISTLAGLKRVDDGWLEPTLPLNLTATTAGVAVCLALLCTVLACMPALIASTIRVDQRGLITGMRDRQQRLAWVAMAAQVGLGFALCLQAAMLGLVLRSLFLANVGFSRTSFGVVEMAYPAGVVVPPDVGSEDVLTLIAGLHSADIDAAAVNALPLSGSDQKASVRLPYDNPRNWRMARLRIVSPEYPEVVGLRFTSGRPLAATDRGQGLVVINDVLATQLFSQRSAVHQAVHFAGRSWRVLGTAAPVRQRQYAESPDPEIYVLWDDVRLLEPTTAGFAVRRIFVVTTGAASTTRTVELIRTLPTRFVVRRQMAFRDLMWAAASQRPVLVAGTSSFAAVALVLLVVGTYGLFRQEVARRRREIVICIALGATVRDVSRRMMAPVLAAYGVAILAGFAAVPLVAHSVGVYALPGHVTVPPITLVAMLVAAIILLALAVASAPTLRRLWRMDCAALLRQDA